MAPVTLSVAKGLNDGYCRPPAATILLGPARWPPCASPGLSETTESIPHPRAVTRSTKGIPSTFVWLYQPAAGGTKLAMQAGTMAPVPRPGKLAEAFILKQNEHQAGALLANLKARMES
jgi:hypothetical protein